MSNPNSRIELKQYCLRNLGAPVLQINVSREQLEDRIDEALQFFQEYHSESIHQTYFKHEITEEDVLNKYISVHDSITSVQRIIPFSPQTSDASMFSAQYQLALGDLHTLGFAGNLINYEITRQYMSLLDTVINTLPAVEYSRHENKLYIFGDWGTNLSKGTMLVLQAHRLIDPDNYPSIYNDIFLKRYLTALIKRQWGINMKKFEGMTMPGGLTMNGQQMYDEAIEELNKIEEEMQLRYEVPPDFMVG